MRSGLGGHAKRKPQMQPKLSSSALVLPLPRPPLHILAIIRRAGCKLKTTGTAKSEAPQRVRAIASQRQERPRESQETKEPRKCVAAEHARTAAPFNLSGRAIELANLLWLAACSP